MIIQEFNLNMIPDSEPVVVHVNQYDTEEGRFVIHLYNGDTPYTPSNASVLIEGRKPDGKVFAYGAAHGVSISGSTVTAPCLIQMTAMEGRTRVNLIVKENGASTGTFVFWLDVQETPINQHVPASDTEIPALVALAEEQAERSEAWAVGTKNGHPVSATDPTFDNNAKYWAEQAASSVAGVASFNGRSGSVLPMAGDYTAEQITYNETSNVGIELGNLSGAIEAAESGLANKADKSDLASISATGSTNATGSKIAIGMYFYLNGSLVKAKADIASGATFTLNTNYEPVTAGSLNELAANNLGGVVDITSYTSSPYICPHDGIITIRASSQGAYCTASILGADGDNSKRSDVTVSAPTSTENDSCFNVKKGMQLYCRSKSGSAYLFYNPIV